MCIYLLIKLTQAGLSLLHRFRTFCLIGFDSLELPSFFGSFCALQRSQRNHNHKRWANFYLPFHHSIKHAQLRFFEVSCDQTASSDWLICSFSGRFFSALPVQQQQQRIVPRNSFVHCSPNLDIMAAHDKN